MPGYRTVLGKRLDEYEIDNEVLYQKTEEVEQSDAKIAFIVPNEAVESDYSFGNLDEEVSDSSVSGVGSAAQQKLELE
jgi:hypothetical protein